MDKKFHIIIVEDDQNLASELQRYLIAEHFTTSIAHNEIELNAALSEHTPDLMLLDINLPDVNGIDLCQRLGKQFTFPIIMLTGSTEDMDKILALSLGAANYLTKPIAPLVLLAYIKTALLIPSKAQSYEGEQESIPLTVTHNLLTFGNFSLNLSLHTLTETQQGNIPISPAEFRILKTFAEHSQRVLSRDQLLELIGDRSESFDRSIDTLISRIRKKIESDPRKPQIIKTLRNSGYLFDISVSKLKSSSSHENA